MSQNVTKIKTRIKSVSGAYKVTSAMKLVSTVKLKQWRNKMLANKDYTQELKEVVDLLLAADLKVKSPFMEKNSECEKKLFIIISSTLGLCGSYNNNIFKLVDAELTKDDEAIILGAKGATHYANEEFNKIEGFNDYSSLIDDELVNKVVAFVKEEYLKKTYSEIHIIYSEYKNSLVFLAKDYQLLPLNFELEESNDYPPIMEPSPQQLIEELIPFYIKTVIQSKFLESAVCEQGARSNAMENATNNAKELLDELKIEFNKARQETITQEITEIVGASKAI